jgi:acyl-CoA reductase-like NAD-dependent aldehyde dehydrogenase
MDSMAGGADDGSLPTVPLLSRGERETIETATVSGVDGPVAAISRTPRVTALDAVETARTEGFDALASMPVREWLERVADAGRRLEGLGPDCLEPTDCHHRRVSRATGLPVGWVQASAHWLGYGLRHAAETLRAQSPTGGLDVYDELTYTRERDVDLAFTPRVRVLGAVMPGNDPAVYAWPALALAAKIPVVIRPSDRDPFTALRLGRALVAAGFPESAVHVLPGERSLGDILCRECDHAMVFGDADAIDPYREDPAVETYGPGESLAVVARDPTAAELDSLARGVVRSAGRACFCLTRVLATGSCDADALAEGLAERVTEATVGPLDDSETDVPVVPDRDRAERTDDRVSALDGRDVTADYREGPRLVSTDDGPVLQPTVLRTPDPVAELPFPFAGVTECSRSALLDGVDPGYLGVVIGDEELEWSLVRSPAVRKVYGGRYPSTVDLRETHEEYLAAFCYETTTYDPTA